MLGAASFLILVKEEIVSEFRNIVRRVRDHASYEVTRLNQEMEDEILYEGDGEPSPGLIQSIQEHYHEQVGIDRFMRVYQYCDDRLSRTIKS